MNQAYLEAKGWTKAEIAHAKAIFTHAQGAYPRIRRLEHLTFWLLIMGFALGAIVIVLELLPVIVLASASLSVVLTFVLASCLGLLLVHAVHDLHLERSHQHAGMLLLCTISVLAIVIVMNTITRRVVAINAPALLLGLAFCAGVLFPYLVHWRVTHESA